MLKFYQSQKEAEQLLAEADRQFPGISDVTKGKEIIIASGVNRELYLVTHEMLEFFRRMNNKRRVIMLGDFFGTKSKVFTPSFSTLEKYARASKRKVVVNSKGEQTFLYGFNLERKFLKSFDSSIRMDDYVVICNENNEALGFGIVIADLNTKELEQKVVKNVLDLGWYLRHKEGID